jgi:hypothetical protein
MKPTVMLIGLGHLGGVVLELLAREPGLGRIVACSRDEARGAPRCTLARMGATAQGFEPQIDYRRLDLDDTAAAAAVIDRERPDLILSTATLQTWWLPELLPGPAAAALAAARFGAWLPIHLPLAVRLMQALRAAGYRGVTLTAPFPDVINVILARMGMAPTSGVGNLDEIVPKVRWLAAAALRAPLQALRVYLVAHHALEPFVYGTGGTVVGEVPPHFLRVELDGRDVTRTVRAEELLLAPCPLPGGPAWAFLTAGSTVRLILAILNDGETLLHAPAPGGLPGGYPVLAGGRQVRPASIPGLDPGEAIALNERSHRFDGIERIEDDGTAVFTAATAGVLRETLGFDCARLRPDEAEARGRELVVRFRDYAARHGVRLEGRG